jgi:hypothetical protein
MNPDEMAQELTAYVDGALDAEQRDQVERLLRHSPEAQETLRRLQNDAQRLRQLPRRRLEPDFADKVVRAIGTAGRPKRTGRPPVLRWAAVAAGIVAAIGLGSVLYVGRGSSRATKVAASRADDPAAQAGLRMALTDLKREDNARQLAGVLQARESHVMELSGSLPAVALRTLEDALQAQGIRILAGPASGLPSQDAERLVYADGLSVSDVAAVLDRLAQDHDHFAQVDVRPVGGDEREQLSERLGVDLLARPKKSGLPEDATVAEGGPPADRLSEAPRAAVTAAQTAPASGRWAFVVPAPSAGRSSLPADIKQFLARRQTPAPGALQVLFLLRAGQR